MPEFTQWNVPSPFPNILYNPAAVDAAIAKTQSELGNLEVNRGQLALEREKLDQQRSAGEGLIKSLTGTGDGTGTSVYPDATPFEQKMGLSEGGRSATKVNDQGYAGQYQFGASRLADLGLYVPAQGEDLKKNEWKGTFKIAPYGVANLQDFLGSPAAQHAAFVAHVADIDKAIASTPGADKFDVNGLRAVAHLGGVGGMREFIASGGNLNRADSNGTSLKQYYQKFAAGGAPMLQQSFGSVHGPGGPPSNLPAVRPGGNVSTAWVDPNAPLPVPPIPPAVVPPAFNPNAGPRVAGASPAGAPDATPQAGATTPPRPIGQDPNAKVQIPPPTITGQADEATPAVEPSRLAMRLGGTDTAGPGAGQATVPPDAQPNRLAYGTDLPGVTIGLPGNGLPAPPPAAAPTVTTAAPAAPAAPTRPPVVAPPPAPTRVIPLEPVLPNGLTATQVRLAASMVQGGAKVSDVAAHIEQWRQANVTGRQQQATQMAIEQQANFDRQKWYVEQQQKAEETDYKRRQDAIKNQREEAAAARAGLPEGYRLDDKGVATRIDGLPPDPKVAQAAKDEWEAQQRKLPFQGNAANAQDRNILITGDPKSPEYHSAYASLAEAKTQEGGLIIHPNMAPYRFPQDADGNPITTYSKPNITIGPGDLPKLRAFETGAAALKSALDDFAKTSRSASITDRLATIAGQPTDLSSAWTNAALMAKGTALYELGVLSGPDMTVIRGALADPSTFMGNAASHETIDKQVARIKALIDTRLDQARQSYGGGMSTTEAKAPATSQTTAPTTAPINPAERKADTTYQTPKGPLKWTGTGWVAP